MQALVGVVTQPPLAVMQLIRSAVAEVKKMQKRQLLLQGVNLGTLAQPSRSSLCLSEYMIDLHWNQNSSRLLPPNPILQASSSHLPS